MAHVFFVYFSVTGHLVCLHVLAVVNGAAVNIGTCMSFWITAFSAYISKNEIAGSHGSSIFSFLRDFHFSIVTISICIPNSSARDKNVMYFYSLCVCVRVCVWQMERKKQRRMTTSSYTHAVSNFIEHIELHPVHQQSSSCFLDLWNTARMLPSLLTWINSLPLNRPLPWACSFLAHFHGPTCVQPSFCVPHSSQAGSLLRQNVPATSLPAQGRPRAPPMATRDEPTLRAHRSRDLCCPSWSFNGPTNPSFPCSRCYSTFRWNPHGSLLCLLRVSAQKSSTENTLPGLVPKDMVTDPHRTTISSSLCGCLSPFLSHSCHQTDYRLRVIMFCLPDCRLAWTWPVSSHL